jgi:hypothetical protein
LLQINNCALAAEIYSGADDTGIAVAPIISVASEKVAIVIDFVNPVPAIWRLIDGGAPKLSAGALKKAGVNSPTASGQGCDWGRGKTRRRKPTPHSGSEEKKKCL